MADILKYETGDIVELKKPHPCGSKMWKILRVGVDYRLECEGCRHIVLIPRIKLYKMLKNK